MSQRAEHEEIKAKAMDLYRRFFYGDELSSVEKSIEKQYLILKQQKYKRYREQGVSCS